MDEKQEIADDAFKLAMILYEEQVTRLIHVLARTRKGRERAELEELLNEVSHLCEKVGISHLGEERWKAVTDRAIARSRRMRLN